MHVGRTVLSLLLVAGLALPPAAAGAAKRKAPAPARLPTAAECPALPAAGEIPWEPGEKLAYDIDVLGAYAGEMALVALPPVGTGTSREYPLRALAASNSFVSSMKRFRGRSTTYVRSRDLHPRRYREDSNEAGLVRSADVVFGKKAEGAKVTVDWTKGKEKGKRVARYANDVFDPVAAAYYLRAIDVAPGQPFCFDAYGLRRLWRVHGTVKGPETVTVPAGTFQAYHFAGTAVRIDNPRRHREVHVWIGADGQRLPLAAMVTLDVGPVRAQLTHVDTSAGSETEESLLAAPKTAAQKVAPAKPEEPKPAEPRTEEAKSTGTAAQQATPAGLETAPKATTAGPLPAKPKRR